MRKTKIQLLLYITISHMSRSEIGNWLEVLKNGTKKRSCKSGPEWKSHKLHLFLPTQLTYSWFRRFWISSSVKTMGLSLRRSWPSKPPQWDNVKATPFMAESRSQMCNWERIQGWYSLVKNCFWHGVCLCSSFPIFSSIISLWKTSQLCLFQLDFVDS